MKVEILRHTADPALLCGQAAAICYRGSNPCKSLEVAMGGGHESVLEHASFTFRIEGVSRVLLAQLTRHRLASYSVQSQRYCGADVALVVPESMCRADLVDDIIKARRAVDRLYKKAIRVGVPKEDARYMTFQASETALIMTMNARELRHFFALRCCTRAQWEIRDLANEMLRLCREVAPVLFEDAGPGCVRGHCPEGEKSCKANKK